MAILTETSQNGLSKDVLAGGGLVLILKGKKYRQTLGLMFRHRVGPSHDLPIKIQCRLRNMGKQRGMLGQSWCLGKRETVFQRVRPKKTVQKNCTKKKCILYPNDHKCIRTLTTKKINARGLFFGRGPVVEILRGLIL